MSDYWADENKVEGGDVEHISPCGRYKLTISEHKTQPGCWSYTSGTVQLNSPQEPDENGSKYNYRTRIAVLKRNYSHFPFCWSRQGDETLLIYGEDYQGYGCMKCSTGERVQYLPPEKRHGWGFCWVSMKVDPESPNHILVNGCVWGGPYENRRYDISNPFAFPYPMEFLGYDEGEVDDDDDEEEEKTVQESADNQQEAS